jgi:HEAT repeat protein
MNRVVHLAVVAALGIVALGASRQSFEDQVASLKSPNTKTRLGAVEELGKSRRREAVAPLATLVHDPEARVRLALVRAFQDLRDLSAVPALVSLLADPDPKVREQCVGALVDLYTDEAKTSPPGKVLDVFSDEPDAASLPPFAEVDPSIHEALGVSLGDESEGVRESAAYALGVLEGRSQAARLGAALQDPSASVRGAAATALGRVGTAEEGRLLIPLLADESNNVRNRALQAIGVLKVREAGPALRELFEANRRRELGTKALACLSKISDPDQADLFRELAQDPDPDRRRWAVEGLGRVADASMLPAFKKDFQRERAEDLRLAYAFAIARLGDHAFLDSLVLGLSSSTYGRRCRGYLVEMGPEILPELYTYLGDPDAEVRAQLCDVIAATGDASAADKLAPLVGDPSPKVADRATRAIERLKLRPSS